MGYKYDIGYSAAQRDLKDGREPRLFDVRTWYGMGYRDGWLDATKGSK